MISHQDLIVEIRTLCADLALAGSKLDDNATDNEESKNILKESANKFIRLKASSRNLHKILENKRKSLEGERAKVDDLQLKLENLLYKQAHLEREVRICKSLMTPSLNALEGELRQQLRASKYSDNLYNFHDEQVHKFHKEKLSRKSKLSELEHVKTRLSDASEVLEKKRKFLDVDLPAKVAQLESSAAEVGTSFQNVSSIDMIEE